VTEPAPDASTLRRRATQAGQEHVFRFWDDLPEAGRRRLLAHLADVNFDQLQRLVEAHVLHPQPQALPADLEPAPFIPLPATEAQRAERERMRGLGADLLAAGKVAAFTVAGGQGTRLGWPSRWRAAREPVSATTGRRAPFRWGPSRAGRCSRSSRRGCWPHAATPARPSRGTS